MIRSLSNPRTASKILPKVLGRHVSSTAVVSGAAALNPLHQQSSSSSSVAGPAAWSGDLSFASPETDFTGLQARITTDAVRTGPVWSGELSFSSPDSDFTSSHAVRDDISTTPAESTAVAWDGPLWSGNLSYASPDSDWCSEVLVNSALASSCQKLPRTYREALLMDEKAAIVITTAASPHRIVYVNRAWEEMCGFGMMEVLNRTLSMIQGPKTNAKLAEATVRKVVEGQEAADMYVVNYRKSGEDFTNHVSLGPLKMDEDSPAVDFMVGILEEVQPDEVPLRMVAYD